VPVDLGSSADLAERTAQLAAKAELEMLEMVSRYLRRGQDVPQWMQVKLIELQSLRRDLTNVLGNLNPRLSNQVNRTVTTAYQQGETEALRDLSNAAFPSGPFTGARELARRTMAPATLRSVQRIAQETLAPLANVLQAVLRSVTDAYQQAVSEASVSVLTGGLTRLQASQSAVNRLLGQGIKGFTDRAGRQWNLDSYVEMATRTGAARAAVQGHADTLIANGHDLAYIIPGPRACPVCDSWAGKVISLTGRTLALEDGTPVVSLRDAYAGGWGHPNCRCSQGAYFPGISDTSDVDRASLEQYLAQQRQREIERNIRSWKRREALALTPEAKAEARSKVRGWQGQMRQHLTDHDYLKRQPQREGGRIVSD